MLDRMNKIDQNTDRYKKERQEKRKNKRKGGQSIENISTGSQTRTPEEKSMIQQIKINYKDTLFMQIKFSF